MSDSEILSGGACNAACSDDAPANDWNDARHYRDIFQRAGQALAIGSRDGVTIEIVNPAFAAMHGYTTEELRGASLLHLFPPRRRAEAKAAIRQSDASGHCAWEAEHLAKDGRVFPVWIDATAVHDETGALQYRIASVQDISERKQAEAELSRSESRFRQLAEAMPQFVWINNRDGRIVYLNSQWTDFTGQTFAQTRGDGGAAVIHPDDLAVIRRAADAAKQARQPYEFEFRCRRLSDGAYYWFLCRVVPILDAQGRLEQWVGTSANIDEQKRQQREIQDLNTRLQRAMQETHHRVKNNLQSISALAEMQAGGSEDMIPRAALERISQHVRALALMHELLTQEARNDVAVRFVSVKTVLSRLLPLMQATIGARQIRYDIAPARVPIAKGASLALLVNELVNNAVKHGAGAVTVLLNVENGQARLEVRDDGAGFRPGFDPACEGHVGLELIDSLARWDLRGELTFANQPQGGAQVIVRFPLDEPCAA